MRLEAKAACVFLCQLVNTGIMKEARVYGCLRVSILLMVESILNKNKNKNKPFALLKDTRAFETPQVPAR